MLYYITVIHTGNIKRQYVSCVPHLRDLAFMSLRQ